MPQQLPREQHRWTEAADCSKKALCSRLLRSSAWGQHSFYPCSDLPLCPGPSSRPSLHQGPAPRAAGAGISGAESQHSPTPPACPRAYLAVTTQVIAIVQPLALGDGELVPPLHEVAQSYVHLPIEDPAWRRREGGRDRVVLGEPSRRGRSHTSRVPTVDQGLCSVRFRPEIVLFHPPLHLCGWTESPLS